MMMIIIMLGWFESNSWLDLNYFEFVVTTDHFWMMMIIINALCKVGFDRVQLVAGPELLFYYYYFWMIIIIQNALCKVGFDRVQPTGGWTWIIQTEYWCSSPFLQLSIYNLTISKSQSHNLITLLSIDFWPVFCNLVTTSECSLCCYSLDLHIATENET